MIKEEGHPCDPDMFADHGTASVGVTTGIDNGLGILGVAPATTAYTYSEWTLGGGRRERSIAQAVSDSGEGDVVLLEMQTGAGGPPEAVEGVWLILRVGADANVLVVSAGARLPVCILPASCQSCPPHSPRRVTQPAMETRTWTARVTRSSGVGGTPAPSSLVPASRTLSTISSLFPPSAAA